MNVTLVSAGSRGDIAPFATLGAALAAAGHATTLLAHDEFGSLLGASSGVRFVAARGANPRDILDSVAGRRLLTESRSPKGFARAFRTLIDPVIETAFQDTLDAAAGSDLLIYPPMAFGGANVAEKLGIQALQLHLQPVMASLRYPTVFSTARTLGPVGNRLSHTVGDRVFAGAILEPMNRARQTVLGLAPVTRTTVMAMQRGQEKGALLAFDAPLVPPARAWSQRGAVQCGALLSKPSAGASLPAEIATFLEGDGPCVYFGFGSMLVEHPAALVEAIEVASQRLGFRAIVQRGWGGLEPSSGSGGRLLFIDEIDHDLLFPLVDGIVHHGGAGTTARAARSGRPSLVVPLMGDQFFWGHRAAAAGLGPAALPCDEVTPDALTERLRALLTTGRFGWRAEHVAAQIAASDPVDAGVRHVERFAASAQVRAA